jgi:hypothetical protein
MSKAVAANACTVEASAATALGVMYEILWHPLVTIDKSLTLVTVTN